MGILVAWRCWRLTFIDHSRDNLFALRDNVRDWFLETGRGLEHPMYRELRDYINHYLRFMQHNRFTGLIYVYRRTDLALIRQLSERIDQRFSTTDAELVKKIAAVRTSVWHTCLTYMVATSFLFLGLTIAITPLIIMDTSHVKIRKLCSIIGDGIKRRGDKEPVLRMATDICAVAA